MELTCSNGDKVLTISGIIRENETIRNKIKTLNLRLNRLIDKKTLENVPINANSYRFYKKRDPKEQERIVQSHLEQSEKEFGYWTEKEGILEKEVQKVRDFDYMNKLEEKIESYRQFEKTLHRDLVKEQIQSEKMTKMLIAPETANENRKEHEKCLRRTHELKKRNRSLEKKIHKIMEDIGKTALFEEELGFKRKELKTQFDKLYKGNIEIKGKYDLLYFKKREMEIE